MLWLYLTATGGVGNQEAASSSVLAAPELVQQFMTGNITETA
jgi:hypothetical protein